ncbi:MAG: hypothetical protein IT371_10845 [Deltaproteobacteria bacterium]|nr:hypothetical protein [Deltaproteobacteria bacterium]
MKRWFLHASALGWVVAVASSCIVDNPKYCDADATCAARGGPALCHPLGHFCYDGCDSDAYCLDDSRDGYYAPHRYCNRATRHCQSSPAADASPTTEAGSRDGGGDLGGSDTAFCAGKAKGEPCGAPRCAGGELTRYACDGAGLCELSASSCGGYACEASGGACKTACGGKADCTGAFECVGKACTAAQENGAPCGTNAAACKSGKCVDGVCCGAASCPTCQSCAVKGKEGACAALDKGPAPSGQCPGDAACGGGTCSGSGTCGYLPKESVCARACTAGQPALYTESRCTTDGKCQAAAPIACVGYAVCAASPAACPTGCTGHSECVAGSLCDRTQAHASPAGLGRCVDPALVQTVPAGGPIGPELAAARTAGKTHVKLPAGTYTENLTLPSGSRLTLVGLGLPNLRPGASSTNQPIVSVAAGATVAVQGLNLTLAGGGDDADGLRCAGTGATSQASLTIVESIIKSNEGQGIEAAYCALTVHRSELRSNQGGGLSAANGPLTLTNSLLEANGSPSSPIGGAKLDPGAASVSFLNNTVVANTAAPGTAAGVICTSSATSLTNSIIWSYLGEQAVSTCSASFSALKGWTGGGTGNLTTDPQLEAAPSYRLKATSPAINAGNTGAAAASSLDLANTLRIKGGVVDLGAYELK